MRNQQFRLKPRTDRGDVISRDGATGSGTKLIIRLDETPHKVGGDALARYVAGRLQGDLNLQAKSLILGRAKKAGPWPALVCL